MEGKYLKAIGTEKVSIDSLIEYEFNNNDHGDKQVDAIASSISTYGYLDEIIIDKNNIIIAGHGRIKSAKKMGYTDIDVKRLDIDGTKAGSLRILHNILANFDSSMNLGNVMAEIQGGVSLDLGEFTQADFFPELDVPEYNPDDYQNDIAGGIGLVKEGESLFVKIEVNNDEEAEQLKEIVQEAGYSKISVIKE